MNRAASIDALGGALLLRPGHPRPFNLASSRRDWAGPLARGRPADALPALLGSLYALCGHAHRLCAGMAVDAALNGIAVAERHLDAVDPGDGEGGDAAIDCGAIAGRGTAVHGTTVCAMAACNMAARDKAARDKAGRALQAETAREHLRRIALDWPLRVAGAAWRERWGDDARQALRRCAFVRAGRTDRAEGVSAAGVLRNWLARDALGMPAEEWLAAWEQAPADWLAAWSRLDGWLPALLRDCEPWAQQPLPSVAALRVHASDEALREFAHSGLPPPGGEHRPYWHGRCAETGPWARLHGAPPPSRDCAWLRLGARLAELARLALPDAPGRSGAAWLARGAVPLGHGTALAWVEMARGLLMHVVRIDGVGRNARIASCRVLAPTEWNFHPQGALAVLLERFAPCPSPHERRCLDVLVAAYDPCVDYAIENDASTGGDAAGGGAERNPAHA